MRMPVRTCVACRKRAPKRDLLRWTVDERGRPIPDPAGRAPGRGGYVCRSEGCLTRLGRRLTASGLDFAASEGAFRLAIGGGLVENVPGESHEN